ncbi:MAG: SCO7613 C-terminal domain-containing membrane protein [Candidatus Nanopelagicales bacterium]
MSADFIAKSPYCQHELNPKNEKDGYVTCECGRKTDVRWVRELGWLQARTLWVQERILNSDPWFDSRIQSEPSEQKSEPRASAGQRILYVLGGLSLIVATVVFTAVAWERIGSIGQLLALLSVAGISTLIALKSRTTLLGLANTAAIVASAVVMTGLIAAPSFGLFPETWSDEQSFYSAGVIYLVGGLSLMAGLWSKIQSWLAVGVLSLWVGTLALVEAPLQSRFQDDEFIIVSYLAYSLIFMLFGKLLKTFSELKLSAIKIVTLISVALTLFIALPRIFGVFTIHNSPFVLALFLIFLACVWMAYFLFIVRPVSNEMLIFNIISIAAPYLSAALFGVGLSVLLLPSRTVVETLESFDVTVIALTLIGSIIAVLGIIVRNFPKSFLNLPIVAAGALWSTTFVIASMINDEIFYSSVGQMHLSQYTFFFLWLMVSASFSFLWWSSNSLGHFIPALVTGVVSLLIFINELGGEAIRGPEPVTIPIALYLLLSLVIRQMKSGHQVNSAITLGIPFSFGYLPSAVVSVIILDSSENVGTMDWLRLWIVLAVGILAIVFGARRQLAGLLYPGAVGFSLAVLPQIFVNLSLYVPRWIIFLVIGIILILIAVRFESLKSFREISKSWFKSLK